MSLGDSVIVIANGLLLVVCVFLLIGSVYLTIKTRFVQIRFLPVLYQQVKKYFLQKSSSVETQYTISPFKALFTAMSTTIGISTIVGPVIAIKLGGPGALLGFLLTSFLGSAVTYVEVNLSVYYRKKMGNGRIMGGPMQYLKVILSPKSAIFYAGGCMILLLTWSAAQANQLAAILDSPSMGAWRVPSLYSAFFLSVFVFVALKGGVKRIGSLSVKMVPVMFVLFIGSSFWIIGKNLPFMGNILWTVCKSAVTPYALANGALVGGVISALRWGIFKGVQVTEAGVGTQTIPHSLAETKSPAEQGTLAMISTLCAGGVSFVSGCVALITNTWQDPSIPLGIGMVSASYQQYFSFAGVAIVAISAALFGFGTILGNSFNGNQCYNYLVQNGKQRYYLVSTVLMVFLGAIGDVKTVWSVVDIILAFLVVPHMTALILSVRKFPELFIAARKRKIGIEDAVL